MSLTVDGVWKSGVWEPTVWADGVWLEGVIAPANQQRSGGPDRIRHDHEIPEFEEYLEASARFVRQQTAKPVEKPAKPTKPTKLPEKPERPVKAAVAAVQAVEAAQQETLTTLDAMQREMTLAALRREERRLRATILLLSAA